jgi:type IV pilus assembly protein PilA
MLVVGLIGVIAAIAIPTYLSYQAKSKTAEVTSNLAALSVAENGYYAERNRYVSAAPEPALIPGSSRADFDAAGSDFAQLGWAPEGRVFFSYAVAVSADEVGFTADAGADTDGDGIVQLWGYANPDGGNALASGRIGCDVSFLQPTVVGRCGTDGTIF